jgi:hypothetical protein
VTRRLDDLRTAANNTLALADSAVGEIESELQGRSAPPTADVQHQYDEALAERDRARTEAERSSTPGMLTQANQDAAQAVLGLQGVMRKLGVKSAMVNPYEISTRKCFYCAHEDRPPYTKQVIDDGRGNSLDVDVCSVCQARLARGQKPQVATVHYRGTEVPWWAQPDSAYYYSYGGPSWQNWIPFMVGMELGTWMDGGWRDYGGHDGGWGAGDYASSVDSNTPSDAGGASLGGWADSGSSSGSGGWSDSGGGWDSGGSDSGGGDSGGGGD